MIKVAIVGTNGLAQYIAHYLEVQTSHQFVILSRRPSPGLTAKGWQVIQLDYANHNDLEFKLAGVDTVISTISGVNQLAIIDAAAAAHVRRFVPSEFGGPPSLRPANDRLDNGRRNAIQRLASHEASGMTFAVFTCGLFMEWFQPGGLVASQIGVQSEVGQEGDLCLLNYRQRRAELPYSNSAGQPTTICLTTARDVARFVVAAIDLASWPWEFRLRGERLSVHEVVTVAEQVRGRAFEVSRHDRNSFQNAVTYARAVANRRRETQLHLLMATAEGRFDFANVNLNQMVNVRPEGFQEFLGRVWSTTP